MRALPLLAHSQAQLLLWRTEPMTGSKGNAIDMTKGGKNLQSIDYSEEILTCSQVHSPVLETWAGETDNVSSTAKRAEQHKAAQKLHVPVALHTPLQVLA